MMIFKKFLKHFLLFYNSIFLDKYEIEFINNSKKKISEKKLKKKNILIQIATDYYYLAYYSTLVNNPKFSNYNFIGLWPYFQQTVRKRHLFLEILNELYNQFLFFFIYIKWSKLYKSIGVKNIETVCGVNFLNKRSNKKKMFFKSREDLLNLNINRIYVGDIIYDTYLRFRASPTLFLKDHFLRKLIHRCYEIIFNLENIFKKYRFVYFLTSYSSYIHHGLPVRFFLKKKVTVYSGKNNSQYNKKLSHNNLSHSEDFKGYKLYFKKIKNKKKILEFSRNDLLIRFSKKKKLKSNLRYLLTDTYNVKKNSNQEINKLRNIDGVLFLQDFYDSPHDWGNLVFNDFYIWTIFTLNIIRKYKLKIAIKPHPNSWHNSADSVVLYERLKKRYRNLTWLNKDFPNKLIFKKIKFGISGSGTVLFELAYHNIKVVSCGDHPGMDFNFTINAKSKKEYKKILLNINKIQKPHYSQRDLLIYNFLYYYSNMDAYESIARKIELKEIDLTQSYGLLKFNKKYENYISK
jgi:hypothetical protein